MAFDDKLFPDSLTTNGTNTFMLGCDTMCHASHTNLSTQFGLDHGHGMWRTVITISHVIPVVIIGTTTLISYHLVKSLKLTWRLDGCRWNLQLSNLQMSCSDLSRMKGYQDSSSNNGHQAACPTDSSRFLYWSRTMKNLPRWAFFITGS